MAGRFLSRSAVAPAVIVALAAAQTSAEPPSEGDAATPRAGAESFIETPGGRTIPIIYIPPGDFIMGESILSDLISSFFGGPTTHIDEGPPTPVTIEEGFYLGKYKVTVEEFCEFLNAVDDPEAQFNRESPWCKIRFVEGEYRPLEGMERCAVATVHWDGAVAFCDWLSEATGRTVRLPTEAEWEFAGRGPHSPGGVFGGRETESMDDWVGTPKLNVDPIEVLRGERDDIRVIECVPVDALPLNVTGSGLHGMAGGISEWTSSVYTRRHDIDPADLPEDERKWRVLKRCLPNLTGRAMGRDAPTKSGVYGFRILVEAGQ